MPLLQNHRREGAQALGVGGIGFANDYNDSNHNGTVRALYHTWFEPGGATLSRDYQDGNVNSGVYGGCFSFTIAFWAYHAGGEILIDTQASEYEESGSHRSFIKITNGSVEFVGNRVERIIQSGYNYPQSETYSVTGNTNAWRHYQFHARLKSDGTQDFTFYYDGVSQGTRNQSNDNRILLITYQQILVGSNSWHVGQGMLLGVRNEQHTGYPYTVDKGLYPDPNATGPNRFPGKLDATTDGFNGGLYQLYVAWKHGVDANWMPVETASYRAKFYNGGVRDLGTDGTNTGLPQPQIFLRGNNGADLTDGGSIAGSSLQGYNKGNGTYSSLSTNDTSDYWQWLERALYNIPNTNPQRTQPYWTRTTSQSSDTFS